MLLYSRLFRHRVNERKTPLEDFLTEALVDLLEKFECFDPEQRLLFIEKVLLGDQVWAPASRDKDGLLKRIRFAESLSWKTQDRSAGKYGRPDIVLYDGKRPLLVVENKIGADFTFKEMEEGDADEKASKGIDDQLEEEEERWKWVGQLSRYDEWISSWKEAGPAGLVLLTHWTDPPSGFANGESEKPEVEFRTPLRAVCRWRAVWKWLESYSVMKPGTWGGALASDLASFLGEQVMLDRMTNSDFDAVRVYLKGRFGGAFNRVKMAMDTIKGEAGRILDERTYEFDKKFTWGGDFIQPLLVWDWVWRKGDKGTGRYIAWGIRFAGDFGDYKEWEGRSFFGARQPEVDEFFVCVDTNDPVNRPVAVSSGVRSEHGDRWEYFVKDKNSLCITSKPLAHFLESEDPMEQLLPWFREAMGDALSILEASAR